MSDLSYDIDFKDGKVVLIAKVDSKGVDVDTKVEMEAGYFLDKLAAAIPGELDDKVFAALKLAMGILS